MHKDDPQNYSNEGMNLWDYADLFTLSVEGRHELGFGLSKGHHRGRPFWPSPSGRDENSIKARENGFFHALANFILSKITD